MLEYLSLDIICSSKLTVFLELRSRKTVRFSKQIMPADKYPSIFSRQMKAIVYIFRNGYEDLWLNLNTLLFRTLLKGLRQLSLWGRRIQFRRKRRRRQTLRWRVFLLLGGIICDFRHLGYFSTSLRLFFVLFLSCFMSTQLWKVYNDSRI